MSVKIEDATSLGTGFCSVLNNSIQATGPQSAATAGFQVLASEVNPAGVGVGRVMKEVEASEDYRLRSGVDCPVFDEKFLGSALASFAWIQAVTTQTVAVSGGAVTLNASAITTLSTVSRVTSQQTVPQKSGAPTYYSWDYLYPAAAPVANTELEMGAVIHTGVAVPTDGAFLRYTTTGTVDFVICYNSSETSTTITAPTGLVNHRCLISAYDDYVSLWIDDVLVARIDTPTGRASPFSAQALPLSFRFRNNSVAPSVAISPQIFAPAAQLGDTSVNVRTSAETSLLGGGMACQAQSGATQGSLANWANTAAPATATLSNTAGGYGTAVLGGQFQFAAPAGAETDYALFGFQVPVVAALQHNKKLVITGINIGTWNTVVAVATTSTVLQWGLGFGSTAISLATTETVGTKAPRRVPVGVQWFAVGAAVGAAAEPINIQGGACPLGVAMPGEFVHVILKVPTGTATATEIFRGVIGLWGYWELPMEIVLSAGPHGGSIVETNVKPGESFTLDDGCIYRRDTADLEMAIYTGGAPVPPPPSRVAATRAAREGA